MRVKQGKLRAAEVSESLQAQIDHYLGGGDLLPPTGQSFAAEAHEVYAAVLEGIDTQPAIDAAWAAFHERYPNA